MPVEVVLRDGTTHIYPDGVHHEIAPGGAIWHVSREKDGTGWLASYPVDAIRYVRSGQPDRVIYTDAALAHVAKHIEDYTDDKHRPYLARIKRGLQDFSVRAGWKVEV